MNIEAGNLIFGGEEQVEQAENFVKAKKKEFDAQSKIALAAKTALAFRKQNAEIQVGEAEVAEESLTAQLAQNKEIAKGNMLLLKLKVALSAYQKMVEIGIKGIKLTFEATKKVFDSTKKTFDYLTGGQISFNLFENLTQGIEDFISKQEEAIGKQEDLAAQLEKREITQEEYDKAIQGGIGKVDNRNFAKTFIDDMIDGAVKFAEAFEIERSLDI